ncbi:hypothetical protein LLH03_03725 [bacterium]|nr:hypothetical protein [bacterium]
MVGLRWRTIGVIAALLFIGTGPPVWAAIQSNFTTDAEGWTTVRSSMTHVDTGGHPGGYLVFQDTVDGLSGFAASNQYHGDLRAYNRGTVSFDMMTLDNYTPNYPETGWVLFYDLDPTIPVSYIRDLVPTGEPSPQNVWHSFSATLNWDQMTPDAAHPAPPSEAAWLDFLADVDNVVVFLDWNVVADERAGFDSFRLTEGPSAVPEPSSWALLACNGLFVVVVGLLRRKRRA